MGSETASCSVDQMIDVRVLLEDALDRLDEFKITGVALHVDLALNRLTTLIANEKAAQAS